MTSSIYSDISFACKALFISVGTFLVPIQGLFILVGLLIALDTIMGVIRAYKTGTRITSRKFSQLIVKMLIYQFTVITLYVLDILILGDIVALWSSIPHIVTKIATLTIVLIEGKSIIENYEIAYDVNVWDIIMNTKAKAKDLVSDTRGIDKFNDPKDKGNKRFKN